MFTRVGVRIHIRQLLTLSPRGWGRVHTMTKAIRANGQRRKWRCVPRSPAGTPSPPPPLDPNPQGDRARGVKGCVSWTQRPQEAGRRRTSQEDTLSTGAAAAAAAEAAGEPPTHCRHRAGRPDGGAARTPEAPLGSPPWQAACERGRRAPPRLPTRSSSLEGCGPARRSPSGHMCTLASGPSSTTTDLCPFTSHHRVLAPPQEAGAPGVPL